MHPFLFTKLVFIGQGRAGKTSLLKNLTNQPFDANEEITDGADVCVVNNSAWERLEQMADENFERGLAEAIGAELNEAASAAVIVYRRGYAWKRRRDEKAGLLNLSQDLSEDDLMQKMPVDIVVKVAKEGRQEEITFHTWDFGGQEVYYVLHHLFITEGVYCLCFDMREAKNNADEWLQYLAFWLNSAYSHVKDKSKCSIILIGTHRDIIRSSDEHAAISDTIYASFKRCSFWKCVRQPTESAGYTKEVPTGLLRKKWPAVLPGADELQARDEDDIASSQPTKELCFFAVDNTCTQDTSGIADVLGAINMLAEKQVRMREEHPLCWLKVLDEVQSLAETKPYIYLNNHPAVDLWTIALAHKVDPTEFDTLVDFFDTVGIFKVCRSKRDSRYDLVVLRPQWLVNVFAAAITCSHHALWNQDPALTSPYPDHSVDLYRFESKAVLSIRLLRHLWQLKRVIPEEQSDEVFQLLVELMLRFDLMFELRSGNASTGSLEDADADEYQCFLVPAMLTSESSLAPLHDGTTAAASPPLRCFFAFREEGSVTSHGGLLPSVVFTKLQAKCARWAQSTSNTEPKLSKKCAEVNFGAQRVELELMQESCTIAVVIRSYLHPQAVVATLKQMIDDVLTESFPSLEYSIDVRDNATGDFLPLERVQLELAALRQLVRRFSGGEGMRLKFRGGTYDVSQFDAWLPQEGREDETADARDQYDVYICAHKRDLEFAHMVSDCLVRQTGGKICIQCSTRVMLWSPSTSRSALGGQHGTVRQDMFSISRSAAFVPIISKATLEQWSFEKRPAKRGKCLQWLSLGEALLTIVQVVNALWNALNYILLESAKGELACTIVMASIFVPFVLHSVIIWRLVRREHASNQAFRE
eukprot:g2625.t1